ncbi:MAG: DUF4230 domain-containing protein [Sphingomonadales bacterium]|nr:DUF4230 domain-containing protein [Sphingomonadales bacterium]MBD3774957.1 DUF4230 domain-containing protein [Paracoccaceae bacterium]
MAGELKEQPPGSKTGQVTASDPRREQSLARIQAVPWLLFIVVLALAAWLGWKAFFERQEGDPVASAMLAFEKQNSLNVFASRFEVVAESEDRRGVLGVDLLKSRQATIIPATVTYRVDLASMDRDRLRWDAKAKQLDVTVPVIRISRPNLDEANARIFTDGNWVTADAQRDLSRNNSLQAERKAATFAQNPEILALARQAARDAIRQNLAIPLQVAGYGDVTVNVRFDGEVGERR